MEKLFALVLSLALVVAFAVPLRPAAGLSLIGRSPSTKDITLTLTGLDLVQNTAAIGSLLLP